MESRRIVIKTPYKRVLLKLSGEALIGSKEFGIDHDTCTHIVALVNSLCSINLQVGIVIGGGNIFRGVKAKGLGMNRLLSDEIGMLATVINGKTIQAMLSEQFGHKAFIMSSFTCGKMVEQFSWHRAINFLEKNYPVIFVGGTGSPFFTTDTAAALRASEINADILLKATKVDGIYDKDPVGNPDAKKYDFLTYSEILAQDLRFMDSTAVALCRENNIPIKVFNLFEKDSLRKAIFDPSFGTLVSKKK